MKYSILFAIAVSAFATSSVFAQTSTLFGYMDFNNFFRSFKDGTFNQVDHQAVTEVSLGDNMIAYFNNQRDFKVYDGTFSRVLTNQAVKYKSSDNYIAWNLGPLLYYYTDGKPHNLTSFGGDYWVKDSLVVFQDTRYNSLNVVYNGKITSLVTSTTDIPVPEIIGENIVLYRDNGDVFRVFYQGESYELGVYNGFNFEFFVGTDILAFNDPESRTFAIFENGKFLDVEPMHAQKVKVGRGFVAYQDNQGNLKVYSNGNIETVSAFPQFWDVRDDVLIWGEANFTHQWFKGKTSKLANFYITEWQLKNDVVVFRNLLGGVSASVAGKVTEITNVTNTEYRINGHGVMVQLFNKQVIILYNDKLYRD
jgi:hypothetical protein